MEIIDNSSELINGAEGVVIHNGNVVLGMQKPKRWYELPNGEKATIIKTLGGEIEEKDENSSKRALVREVLETKEGIEEKDIRVSKRPIFTKRIRMGELNPYERQSELSMKADFYLLEISKKKNIKPNDLPALLEIPLKEFLKLDFARQGNLNDLQAYVKENEKGTLELPEHYAFMIPREVKDFFERMRGNRGDDGR